MKTAICLAFAFVLLASPACADAATPSKCGAILGKSTTHNLIEKFKSDVTSASVFRVQMPPYELDEWAKRLEKAAWEDAAICQEMWATEIDMQIKIDKLQREIEELKYENARLKDLSKRPLKR